MIGAIGCAKIKNAKHELKLWRPERLGIVRTNEWFTESYIGHGGHRANDQKAKKQTKYEQLKDGMANAEPSTSSSYFNNIPYLRTLPNSNER